MYLNQSLIKRLCKKRNRITHIPIMMDRYIKTDLSFAFLTAIILRIKAIISTKTATPTVKSHQ